MHTEAWIRTAAQSAERSSIGHGETAVTVRVLRCPAGDVRALRLVLGLAAG